MAHLRSCSKTAIEPGCAVKTEISYNYIGVSLAGVGTSESANVSVHCYSPGQ